MEIAQDAETWPEIEELMAKINSIRSELNSTKEQLKEEQAKSSNLSNELNNSEANATQLEQASSAVKEELETARKELEEKLNKLASSNTELIEKVNNLESTNDEYQTEVETLKAELESIKTAESFVLVETIAENQEDETKTIPSPAWAVPYLAGGIITKLMLSWERVNKIGLANMKSFIETYKNNGTSFFTRNSGNAAGEGFELNGLASGEKYRFSGFYDIETSRGPVTLVKILNPQGQTQWEYEWSNGAEEWGLVSDDVKNQIGYVNENEQFFFMTISDWVEKFETLNIRHTIADDFSIDNRINGTLKVSQNCATRKTMSKIYEQNIQMTLEVTEKQDVWVQMLMDSSLDENSLVMFNLYKQGQPATKKYETRFADGTYVKPFFPAQDNDRKLFQYSQNGWCYKLEPGHYFLMVVYCLSKEIENREYLIRVIGQNLRLKQL